MTGRPLTDVLGPIERWLISPEEIEQAAAGICWHLLPVWECRPCLTDRLRVKQGQKLGGLLGMDERETAELVDCFVSLGREGQ